MKIKNIIFDWSGTLSDDFTPTYEAAMIVMNTMIGKKISVEEFRKEFVLPYMDFWHKYIPELTKERCNEIYLDAIRGVENPKAFDGVNETLKSLKTKGINMIIVSAHPQDRLARDINEYGFRNYFQEANGGIYDKTEIILEILQRNSFDSSRTMYVGDMVHDIDAGKKAGVATVAIGWGYQSEEKLMESCPDYFIPDIYNLEKLL